MQIYDKNNKNLPKYIRQHKRYQQTSEKKINKKIELQTIRFDIGEQIL